MKKNKKLITLLQVWSAVSLPTFCLISCVKNTNDKDKSTNNKDNGTSTEEDNNKILPSEMKDKFNYFKTDKIINNNFNTFYQDLFDSATNEVPTVLISRNASQAYIALLLQMIGDLEISNGTSFANIENNDILLLVDQMTYNSKKTEKQKFNFKDILDKYKNDKQKDLAIYHNLNQIDPTKDVPYERFLTNKENGIDSLVELKTYLKKWLDKNNDQKFDFYIPELSWFETKDDTKLWDFITKHANKIIFITDGNALTWQDVSGTFNSYFDKLNNQISPIVPIQDLKKDIEKRYSTYAKETKQDKKLPKWLEEFKLDSKIRMYSWTNGSKNENNKITMNYSPVDFFALDQDMNLNGKVINSEKNIIGFEINDFSDLLISNASMYDKKKKNVIWSGSSLFISKDSNKRNEFRFNNLPHAKYELQNLIKAFQVKFPPSEYNWLFKLHPYFRDGEESLNYIKEIAPDITHPIVIKSSASIENIITYDIHQLKNGKEAFLFDKEDQKNINSIPKTTFIGGQPSTSLLSSVMHLISSSLNISLNQANRYINPANFPYPSSYHTITRDTTYVKPSVGKSINLKSLEKIYKDLIDAELFPTLDSFVSANDIIEKYLGKEKTINPFLK
ncbi:hypothetical protein [Mycoplasma crocodyli]|uniref:Lipoprotein n=1 Tax=Mycoplasma crocodyli (strain ATCC 51981 / MP145) TaxID=512564 RepID=D5E5N4_MYCCM|nr:hypothetical protein [Mycoplasma crocodyli]ADE19683.1 lipoprotein [Mycoplasma crocodyli MP145]